MLEPDSNFLRMFVQLFEGTEVPDRFATWAGISCLSAMLERRVWIDMNIYTIYPNTFIVFVADSGRMRKSTAINVTKKLLAKTDPGPKIVAQKITPEALIDALKVIRSDDQTLILQESCGGIVIADELVSFINKDTYERGLGGLMIQLWDCPDKYEYRTRNRSPEIINFGHLSLLGGTTVHTLKDAIPLQALGDGFSSRVIFVYVDETPEPVPRPVKSTQFHQIEERLVLQLQRLSSLEGPITLSPDTEELFDKEYIRFFRSKFYDEAQFQAYASRRDKHLLKVAMCMMAADTGSMIIEQEHLYAAKVLLEDLEGNMGTVFDRIMMTEVGIMTEKVFSLISSSPNKTISRALLLRKLSHRINAMELTKVVETLIVAKRIKLDTLGNQAVYVVIDH